MARRANQGVVTRPRVLPAPASGRVVTIKLDDWPAYAAKYGLEPWKYQGWGREGRLICKKEGSHEDPRR